MHNKNDKPKTYTVQQVADILSVCNRTVYKWLAEDEDGNSVIPPDGWFRTPGGHYRIRSAVVQYLMNEL